MRFVPPKQDAYPLIASAAPVIQETVCHCGVFKHDVVNMPVTLEEQMFTEFVEG